MATTPTDIPDVAPASVVTGKQGTVSRLRPAAYTAVPVHVGAYGAIVDMWRLGDGMHMMCLRGESDEYMFVLCYVDGAVRKLAAELGINPSLAVDVWHVQKFRNVYEDDMLARAIMRRLAWSAANGQIAFAPIKMNDRRLWRSFVDAMCAVVTSRGPTT